MAHPSVTLCALVVGLVAIGTAVPTWAREVPEHPDRVVRAPVHHWEKTHPWRDQVNDRLARQHRRIRNEVREGALTPAQAQALHAQERQVRAQERTWAAAQGGHITRAQQAQLNTAENQISSGIGR